MTRGNLYADLRENRAIIESGGALSKEALISPETSADTVHFERPSLIFGLSLVALAFVWHRHRMANAREDARFQALSERAPIDMLSQSVGADVIDLSRYTGREGP